MNYQKCKDCENPEHSFIDYLDEEADKDVEFAHKLVGSESVTVKPDGQLIFLNEDLTFKQEPLKNERRN